MKSLDLNQMEVIEGGWTSRQTECAVAAVGLVATYAGAFFIVGPVGAALWGATFIVGSILTTIACSNNVTVY
ncbi:MAG: hypothetical protein OXE55_06675 [Flavobacteriaceae bacterium]|nr:hypothetical protein [Flavobacteriaceae bacterium]